MLRQHETSNIHAFESSDNDLVADASPQNLMTHWWADALPQCSTLSAPSLSHSRSAFAERFGLRYQWDDPLLDGYPPYPFISFHMIFWVSFLGSSTDKEIEHLNIVLLSQTGIGPQETTTRNFCTLWYTSQESTAVPLEQIWLQGPSTSAASLRVTSDPPSCSAPGVATGSPGRRPSNGVAPKPGAIARHDRWW